jgi:lipopolysaccharide assembly protein A
MRSPPGTGERPRMLNHPAGLVAAGPAHCTASERRNVMPEPAAPRYDSIRAPLRPSVNGSARPPPAPPARRRPTRIASIRIGLLAGVGALILLVIFIVQNAHAVHVTFFGAHASVSLAVALLVAAIAGALVMTAAGTARITQLRRTMRRASTAGHAHAPASDTHRDRNTGPGRPEPGPRP